ncbi:ketopantoate reductase family protein [Psychromonas antarctica]|uniref:ketopantoate reductase family protein n=1 Tax=Psychromonas antarctica TaxID=67573 RepID=UPI001EE82627|nr:2-dehydropantoate 2-reductase [Psychromonas antarctica]MCG6201325.1 2-dehydropantoate 2-reductase [Psychromonas antarctica]
MWQIIGAGAIGCLWAANLKRIGQPVHLVTRIPSLTDTLKYQDLHNDMHHYKIIHSTSINSISPLLICVKATQVENVIATHINAINAEQPIILMHNGMGCAERVQALLPNNPIICATTANAALLHAPLSVQQTGQGMTYLGPFNNLARPYEALAEPLNSALGNTYWCDQIKHKLWLKILINMAINPLTAIYQINNGQLLKGQLQKQIKAVAKEGVKLAVAEQVSLTEDELLNRIKQVITQTAQNYSSMNRDIHFQRTTENEHIAGYLLKKGMQHHITLPTIQSLYSKIKLLENYNVGESLNNCAR